MSLLLHALIMAFLASFVHTGAPMWSRWSLGLGAPLFAGLINGLIMGDLNYGLVMGATTMMVYIGVAVVGNAMPGDFILGGFLGVTVSMLAHVEPSVGLTVTASLGALSAFISPVEMTLNTLWVAGARKAAGRGDNRMIMIYSVFTPLIWAFIIYFIPGFILIYFGSGALDKILSAAPLWVSNALNTVGHILPALGLGMLMNLIFKKSLIPFFIIGFCLTIYFNQGIIAVVAVGAALSLLHYMYSSKKKEEV